MKIKVCGITSLEQMQQLEELGVDYAGMIFYEGSKRYINNLQKNHLDGYREEIRNLSINKVGVFVNEKFETITKAISDYDLHAVQLHGNETDEFCLELMDKVKVIKVFRLTGEENIDELVAPFQNVCHYFMFDTARPPYPPRGEISEPQPSLSRETLISEDFPKSEVSVPDNPPPEAHRGAGLAFGGTGLQFDWTILMRGKINKPFFLSGGITLEDVEKIKTFMHPCLFAVDVNSRFEISPGIKDMEKVERFISALNF